MRGFTLVEILVSITIFTIVLGLGLFMTMDTYRAYISRSERDMVVSELQLARSRAMNNIYETNWGVCYDGTNYIVFRGTYTPGASTNESTPASASATLSSTGNAFSCATGGIVFQQLTGQATVSTITVVQNGQSKQISTNNEGAISW